MTIFRNSKWPLTILLLSIFLVESVDAQIQRNKPPLLAHGSIYQNSCDDDHKKLLKSIISNSSAAAPTEAWRIIEIFLCLTRNNKNITTALDFTEKNIKQKYEETGSKPRTEITVANKEAITLLMADGDAWDVEIQATSKTLEVHYLKNEACIEGLIFRYRNEQWYLSESSVA